VELRDGHKFRTFHDFGIVILDILYCYGEDSGTLECRAVNNLGSDSTSTTILTHPKPGLILDPQIPKSMHGAYNKIHDLENKTKKRKAELQRSKVAPEFIEPLENVNLKEGELAHLECKVTPVDDPDLTISWLLNDKPLRTGSRFKHFNDFGFVILEISGLSERDAGVYSCRATNKYGQAVTVCNVTVSCGEVTKGYISENIAKLEGFGLERSETMETVTEGSKPQLTELNDLTVFENGTAHFETKFINSTTADTQIQWFCNGKLITQGSRIKTINDFGFVILEINNIQARDRGEYVCKASNSHGNCEVRCNLVVTNIAGKIISSSQLPAGFKGENIRNLEEYKSPSRDKSEERVIGPPVFVKEIQDVVINEGESVRFEGRIDGYEDTRIEWYCNGKPLVFGSRIHARDDFGFVSLDLDWTFLRDQGEYICRAVNSRGEFTTSRARIIVKGE